MLMGLLITLNEDGYLTLKNDREVILNKIKELEVILNELTPAFNHLQPFYEPKIDIIVADNKDEEIYVGKCLIPVPDKVMKQPIQFEIGSVKNYKGIDDENLVLDAKIQARRFMSRRFPTYFE